MMDSKIKYPAIHEVFPNLFSAAEMPQQQQSWHLVKERMLDFAEGRNKKNRGD